MDKEPLFESIESAFSLTLVKYKGTTLLDDPTVYADDLDQFKVHDDDVWLCGFMRSGTHWAKEMIWQIANGVNLETTELLSERFPCFETFIHRTYLVNTNISYDDMLMKLKSLPSPRFLKSHLPFNLLPRQLKSGEKKVKMIYIARDPKDVCVSLYYFYKRFCRFKGNIEEICAAFINNKVIYAPYWDNVLSYWRRRKDFNILFLKYEDMKNDLPSVIRRTADFLGKTLTEEQVSALSVHLSFDSYSRNPTLGNRSYEELNAKLLNLEDRSNGLVRKGTVGQWKQEMTADAARRLDEWIAKNLQNSDYDI